MTKPSCLLVMTVLGLSTLGLPQSLSAADKKVVVVPGKAPSPNFSAGIWVGDTLYVAGQTGNDPKGGGVPEDFEAEVKQALDNVGAVLKAGGVDFSHVVAVTVFMTDMDLFQKMNGVYTSVFQEPRPTRTTVGVAKLVGKSRIEITVLARK
ncbi:MAG: RidA family protein [Bryobacteraceae bacterium]